MEALKAMVTSQQANDGASEEESSEDESSNDDGKKNAKAAMAVHDPNQMQKPLRQAWQNNVSPEFMVAVLEKLTAGTGSSIAEVVFPQTINFHTGLSIGILRFNKRRALTDLPLRGIFLTPQKYNHSFALSVQTMAQYLLQELQAAEDNMSKIFDTPLNKQKVQNASEVTPTKEANPRQRAQKRTLQTHPSILLEKLGKCFGMFYFFWCCGVKWQPIDCRMNTECILVHFG